MAHQPEQSLENRSILSVPICAIDFETTGLNKKGTDRAIEIALVRREPNGNIHAWSSLIKSPKSIPVESQKIHNISNAMIKYAPSFNSLYPRIQEFIEGSILIAHNSPFDMTFLQKECEYIKKKSPKPHCVIDTLNMARSFLNLPQNSLSSLSQRIKLLPNNAHRAMTDAQNALFLFLEILGQSQSIESVIELEQHIEKYRPKGRYRLELHKQIRAYTHNGQRIKVQYTSSDPNRPLFQERIIKPIRIRDQYLEAFCELRKASREFRICRIHHIEPVEDLSDILLDSV